MFSNMLKHSRVALMILLKEPTGKKVTEHLEVSPTRIREITLHHSAQIEGKTTTVRHMWELDSPKDQNFEPIVRLDSLIDLIELFQND